MVIKGATILDITTGSMIKNHVVVVKDGRIEEVSQRAQPISLKASRWLICGQTLLPGLIDIRTLTSGGGYHGYERQLTDERQAILGVVHAKQR